MKLGHSELSAALLLAGLGLTAASFAEGEEEFNKAAARCLQRRLACLAVLAGENVVFQGLDALRSTLEIDAPLVVAVTELGSINLSVTALRHCGVQIVTPFWDIGDDYRRFANAFEVPLVSVKEHATPTKLLRALIASRDRGLVPCLVVEAPSRSRHLHSFLNCTVRCSSFLAWMANRFDSGVVLIWNRQLEPDHVAVGFEWVPPGLVSTQRLLWRIDTEVRRDPSQYTWENSAILFF